MKRSLSAISTATASFAEDVAAYAAAGFDAIGLWEMKLPDDDVANVDLLHSHGLTVSNCIPTVPSFLPLAIPGMEGPADPGVRLDAICASIRRLARYEPGCVLAPTCHSPSTVVRCPGAAANGRQSRFWSSAQLPA